MDYKLLLDDERQLRKAAEAEVIQLRMQLAALSTQAVVAHTSSPEAAQDLAQVISQLKQTELQLEDQQGFVRQVIDNSPNLVYVENEAGRCVLANRRYAQLLSQQAHIIPPESKLIGPAPSTKKPSQLPASNITSFEECYHLEDGQTIWYHTTKSPLVGNDGARYMITFSSDITDLKKAHQIAEESIRARQVFMANMSHEIRTPLHGVMGLTELIKKEPLSAEQSDYVEMIQSSTENLMVVINDILDFTKIESGKISLESIPFDILKTVQDAARSLSFKMNEKGLLLRIKCLQKSLPLAQGDPFRLHQVLVNLINNAIKFTNHGSITITIDAGKEDGLSLPVTFSVADTGIGISQDNISQIFTSFRQADSSITRLYGGTGLGLTICKNLVELQGGQIEVNSQLGRGSCFRFTVPYTVSSEPLVKESATIQQPHSLQGLSVLLAEDNAINQLIAVSMLNQWDVRVEMAQNGEEALAKAFHTAYDLILMDIQMPQLDGIEATAQLRAAPGPNQHTPIIALTADAMRVNANSCQLLGFTECLTKPYTELALYKLLAHFGRRGEAALSMSEAAPANGAVAPYYDFHMLGKLGSDKGFIRKMLTLFLARVPGQVEALLLAVEEEDWLTAAREAHILKTTFGNLSIRQEMDHLRKIEKLAELQAPKSEFKQLINSVDKATQQLVILFTEELNNLTEVVELQDNRPSISYSGLQASA